MLNAVASRANASIASITQAINDLSQGLSDSRKSYGNGPGDNSWPRGSIVRAGTRLGAQAASVEKYVAKYVVGRGFKQTDGLMPSKHVILKQHGLAGLALRAPVTKLGSLCGVSQSRNLMVSLLDALMAAARFVVIGLPEASLVAVAWLCAGAAQLAYNGAVMLTANVKAGITARGPESAASPAA